MNTLFVEHKLLDMAANNTCVHNEAK